LLPEEVAKLKYAKSQIEDVLIHLKPLNNDEWDLEVTLSNINKSLRKIEWSKLGQQPLPEPLDDGSRQESLPLAAPTIQVPMVVCSTCLGEKTVVVGDGDKGVCPSCHGEGRVPEKKETTASSKIIEEGVAAAQAYNAPKDELPVINCPADILEKILAINSSQSLCEKKPLIKGAFNFPGPKDPIYVCTGSVWNAENKEVAALCWKIIAADKYEGEMITTYNGDGEAFEGLKIVYHDKDYVLTGGVVEFKTATEEKPAKEKKTRQPRKKKGEAESVK